MFLTKAELLTPQPLATKTVTIPGMGDVRLRAMSHAEAAKYYMWQRPNGKACEIRKAVRDLKLLTLSIVDEAGELILSESDIEQLQQQPSTLLDDLIFAAMQINGMIDTPPADDLLGKSDS